MKSLYAPLRVTYELVDREGTRVIAEVAASESSEGGQWIWHAVFPGTGNPPAEILGASVSHDAVASDIAARVLRLKMVDSLAVPSFDPPEVVKARLLHAAARRSDDGDLANASGSLLPG